MSRKNKRRSPARRARSVFNRDALSRICTMPERDFAAAFGMQTVKVRQGWPSDFYHFRDNGSRVLAVAHLDTVAPASQRAAHFTRSEAGLVVHSRALDDRLGAYIMLDMLPALGITYDWLLTTGEETGQSTASFFTTGKDYDWIIEFDRGGTDVVMYQYDDTGTRLAVKAAGAEVGEGIFSDICYLEHLGAKGFNWGTGYRQYHSVRSHAYLADTFAMVGQYLTFHEMQTGVAMPHTPRVYDDDTIYASDACALCGVVGRVDVVTWICEECGGCQDCLEHRNTCMCYTPKDSAALARLPDDIAADWEADGYRPSQTPPADDAPDYWDTKDTGGGWAGASVALTTAPGHPAGLPDLGIPRFGFRGDAGVRAEGDRRISAIMAEPAGGTPRDLAVKLADAEGAGDGNAA